MNPRPSSPILAGLLLALSSSVWASSPALSAQEGDRPFARARLDPGPAVTVGQPLTVEVEVLVPSFFSGAPRYADLDLPDALVLFVDRGRNFSERIGGESWAGQMRRYLVYPQRPGSYEIPEIPVEVRYSVPGIGPGATATASPPPVVFEATLPPGTEGLSYFIAAENLKIEQTFDQWTDTLLVGEAFTRTVTATVTGALSMVIPPMIQDNLPGLAIYPAPPVVEDEEGERMESTLGRRVESVTYVAEEEGDYRIPGVQLQWWDWNAGELRTASLPPVDLHVAPNPALVPEIPLPEDTVAPGEAVGEEAEASRVTFMDFLRRWGVPFALFLLAVGLALRLYRRFGPKVLAAVREARHRRLESERHYFKEFQRAARSGDPRAAARQLMRWLDRRSDHTLPATVTQSLECADDPPLAEELRMLDARLYGPSTSAAAAEWSGRDLGKSVVQARKKGMRPDPTAKGALDLGPLNRKG